ncbi:MAG: secretin N-terminal domain-containing protein [Planctomycetales bacterium]
MPEIPNGGAQPAQPATPPTQPATTPADPNQGGAPAVPPKPRPDRPERPANPEELKIRPDKDGKVQVNFRGQPWQDVLDWVAEISKCSLDWQEMPGGFLNLQTQRSYSVPEIRDMINRHLLDRGYSMLQQGEVISVVNLKKVDPSMVPRVEPEELLKHQPYEFVRASFPLDWLIAESAVEELKPMLSPNGKITPMKATNRVEVMDSVANLIPVWDMIKVEQSSRGKDRLVKQFKLKHTRAGEVIDLLYGVLGMEKPSSGQENASRNPQEMMMRQQMMMQQQQMMQQQGAAGMANRPQQTKVTLVVNVRENSILASAPPDRMEAIKNAIEIIDVPTGGGGENGLPNHIGRVQVYRMTGVDPDSLVKMLQQMGTLDPTTQLEVDKKHKAIIANATPPDHAIIKALVDRLDGSGRNFEVRKLRRLQADSAAGSIEFMFGTPQKKDQSSRRRGWGWDWGGYGGGSSEEPKDESKEFRVEADVENNRLLLYANALEMEQIDILLEKLGEVSPRGSNRRVRVIENLTEEEYQDLVRKLQKNWKNVGPNELRVPERQRPQEEKPPEPKAKPAPPPIVPRAPAANLTPDEPRQKRDPLFLVALAEAVAQNDNPAAAPPQNQPPAAPQENAPRQGDEERPRERKFVPRDRPPINLSRDRNGNLVITSDDIEALDEIERLAEELRPARRDWKIFPLKNKNSSPTYIKWNLEDFFKAQDDSKSESDDDYMRLVRFRTVRKRKTTVPSVSPSGKSHVHLGHGYPLDHGRRRRPRPARTD